MTAIGLVTSDRVPPRRRADMTELELRALRALRRAGSMGLLQNVLIPRMRPGRQEKMRPAIEQLEQRGLIEKAREPRHTVRVQTIWRITARGRLTVEAADATLPPPAA